jgi:PKD repeat protein
VVREVRNITDGFFSITARTAGDGGVEVSEVVEIDVTGFAANITLTVSPTSIPPTGALVQLSALVRDDFGDAAVGEGVNFLTDLGNLASGGGLVRTNEGGQAFDTLTITEADLASLPPGSGITVSAEVPGSGGVLLESEPFTISLQTALPIAGFDFEVVGLTVNFTNTTTGDPPLTYEWDFGDGGTSTSANPGNTYAAEGTYSVSLTATNLGGSDTITKDVVVAASPDISASPTSINFGSVSNPGSADRILTISNAGGAPLTILGLTSSNSVFSVVSGVPPTLNPGDSANVTLRFTPGVVAANTSETGTLTITSNDPDEVTVTVALSGTATP